jgi:DNA-binding transcriptional LysR family regulator
MRGLDSGHLQLAVTSSAKYFAPRLLGAFIQRYPGVETSLHINNRSALLERLKSNEDDLYMFAGPPDQLEVMVQAILSNPMVVIARSDHPLASEKDIAFARLANEPFLIREPGSGTRMAALKLFEQRGLTPKIRMELNTNEAIREAILAGLGVSILSRYTFGLEPEQTKLVCLDVEGFPLESYWHFVYPVGKRLSVAARAFMDFARAEAKILAFDGLAPRPH